jgi:hypothetical protein
MLKVQTFKLSSSRSTFGTTPQNKPRQGCRDHNLLAQPPPLFPSIRPRHCHLPAYVRGLENFPRFSAPTSAQPCQSHLLDSCSTFSHGPARRSCSIPVSPDQNSTLSRNDLNDRAVASMRLSGNVAQYPRNSSPQCCPSRW